MREGRTIELLSPAKNLECGIEAIKHGADAVYIGASRFGARQAAGNSVADIGSLTYYAHQFGAKVYVTVNTILNDYELRDAERLIWNLYEVDVDAILVQDMAVLRMKLPPIALHASTQCDVRTAQRVRFLADCGFTRVVLARELSLEEIREIHNACPDVELECFVHGALCVSYSGQCYASQYCFGRSANRGECAQFCRLKFDLVDSDNNVIVKGKHLLSLRDMNRMDYLEELMDAGVCSFKIEGRLKDVSYVKNVTAAYNKALESVLRHRPDLQRASLFRSVPMFKSDVSRSFNRGFTDYFLHGRTDDIYSFGTPKSIGEKMGTVKEIGCGWLTVAGFNAFHNGDGLCYFNREGELVGYRVNRVEGGRIFLFLDGGDMPQIKPGTEVYRNFDQDFEKMLSKESAVRKIGVDILFEETPQGFKVTFTCEDGLSAQVEKEWKKEPARKSQEENIRVQLSKLGGTNFKARNVEVQMSADHFIPSSILSDMRQKAVEELEVVRMESYGKPVHEIVSNEQARYPETNLTYLGNAMNAWARTFYRAHGVTHIDDAFEIKQPDSATIMFCRHCIKYALGLCTKRGKIQSKADIKEPLYLQSSDGRRFRLKFDCSKCQMEVSY